MWQVFICGTAVVLYYSMYIPVKTMYVTNNSHRTYAAAIAKEKAYKKKVREAEQAE